MRYIALVWDRQDETAAFDAHRLAARCLTQSRAWRTALEIAGLTVLYARGNTALTCDRFPVGRGVILGRLFSKPTLHSDDPPPAPMTLTSVAAERVISSGGRVLIEQYWGDYVAFFREWSSSAICIVRGPLAPLNCLHTCADGVHMYCSDLESCEATGAGSFSVNWWELARSLVGPQLPTRTHLNEVRELLPGTCERVFQGRLTSQVLWNAAEIARDGLPFSPSCAARALRTLTRACVQARANEFSNVIMSLSGGLDSSIILSCLNEEHSLRQVLCLNQYAEDDESDERPLARRAAAHFGYPLTEIDRSEVPGLCLTHYPCALERSPGLRLPEIDRVDLDVAQSTGAQAIFYGHGGDELFCRVQQPLYVSDFLMARGFAKPFASLLLHAAHGEGVTLWRMIGRCLQYALLPARFRVTSLLAQDLESATLLRREVQAQLLNEYETCLEPGSSSDSLGPGRRWQLALLGARRYFGSPFDGPQDAERISPILSQPIVELCLRVPTWYQMLGRRDRALAREAFARDLPHAVLLRADKGGAESLASRIIEKNFDRFRALLLDGLIARSGLFDGDRLEAALSEAPGASPVTSVALFDLLGAELWARTCALRAVNPLQKSARMSR